MHHKTVYSDEKRHYANAKISVLMSVYRKERPEYLKKALDSVLMQTIRPDELVLVEDGALGDELEKVIKQYEKKYNIFHVVRFKENRGLGFALRDGLLECKNELVFRMDSDDISVKNRFERQLDAFAATQADIIGSNIIEYDTDMISPTGERRVPKEHNDICKAIKTKNPINHMTVAFRKSQVLKAGNYQPMPGFEDYYLWARMAKNGSRFYNIQDNLVKVRGGSSLMSRRGGLQYLKSIYRFEKSLYKQGSINVITYYANTCVRSAVCICPSSLRKIFYGKLLRRKV